MADTDLKSRIGKTASAAVAAVLSAFMYMAFNYIAAIGAAVILLLAVRLVIYKKELKTFDAALSAGTAVCIAGATAAAAHHIPRTLFVTAASVITLCLLTIPAAEDIKKGRRKAGGIAVFISGCAFFCLVIIPLFVFAIFPDAAVKLMQTALEPYPEAPEMTVEVSGGRTIYRDVTYESGYPNSTYTVYSVKDSDAVFFYIHGGGLV
ncbi:MAG: hypothetical protein J5592_06345, partial [Clostridia bacterium]|nr:hypothetical protein [Clostridia bacterium]